MIVAHDCGRSGVERDERRQLNCVDLISLASHAVTQILVLWWQITSIIMSVSSTSPSSSIPLPTSSSSQLHFRDLFHSIDLLLHAFPSLRPCSSTSHKSARSVSLSPYQIKLQNILNKVQK